MQTAALTSQAGRAPAPEVEFRYFAGHSELIGWKIAILSGPMLRHMRAFSLSSLSCIAMLAGTLSAGAACIDLKHTSSFSFEGALSFSIFAGPPNYDDVRKGDVPEPAYILKLDAPICVTGDEHLKPEERVDRIQVYPTESGAAGRFLSRDLRRFVGRRVAVEGKSLVGKHTGHHHAPLLLAITEIAIPHDPMKAYGTAMTTVQAFYMALGLGNGEEASKFVVPDKRQSGTFSPTAITNFYSRLIFPLTVLEVIAVTPNEYRVRYTYVAPSSGRCNGESIVRTTKINGLNLIESIRAVGEC
jgi:hypothetical protein